MLAANESIIRLVISSDNQLFREGLCRILAEQTNPDDKIEVIEQADNDQLAAAVYKFKPAVVLLDITLLPSDALTIIPQIIKSHRDVKVLILAADLTDDIIQSYIKMGACGCISAKYTKKSDLINAIKAINRGEFWVERKITAKILKEKFQRNFQTDGNGQSSIDSLTKREKEILSHLAKGLSNKEIASALFISDATVKSHINRIFKKLSISRRMEALLFAIKNKLLEQAERGS